MADALTCVESVVAAVQVGSSSGSRSAQVNASLAARDALGTTNVMATAVKKTATTVVSIKANHYCSMAASPRSRQRVPRSSAGETLGCLAF